MCAFLSLDINCSEQVVIYTLIAALAASIVIEISVVAAAPNAKQKPKANAKAKQKKNTKTKQNRVSRAVQAQKCSILAGDELNGPSTRSVAYVPAAARY